MAGPSPHIPKEFKLNNLKIDGKGTNKRSVLILIASMYLDAVKVVFIDLIIFLFYSGPMTEPMSIY